MAIGLALIDQSIVGVKSQSFSDKDQIVDDLREAFFSPIRRSRARNTCAPPWSSAIQPFDGGGKVEQG